MSTDLRQIDRDLIQLLGKRIALVADRNSRDRAESPDRLTPQLMDAGVPEFVWRNLMVSCQAAIAVHLPSQLPQPLPRRIVLVGGRGKMGQFFAQQFRQMGHRVDSLGRQNWEQADYYLKGSDLVLISVPPAVATQVVKQTAPYLEESTVLADVTSIKQPIMQAMLEHHPGPVVGLHPMFGPGADSFLSQTVVVCPGRSPQASEWLLELIAGGGGRLTYCTPAEHDRMMVTIQAIRHFWTFSLGVFLAQEGTNITQSLDFSSPLYRLAIAKVSRLFAQEPSLCFEIMLNTDSCRQTIDRFAATFRHLADLVQRQDTHKLSQTFADTRSAIERTSNSQTATAIHASNYVIESLMVFLAAQTTIDSKV